MAYEDDIGSRRLMGSKPVAEVVPSNFDGAVRLVTWVDLGVDNMCLIQGSPQERMDMEGKGPKGLVIAVEAVDVDEEQCAAWVRGGDGGDEGLGRRGAWVRCQVRRDGTGTGTGAGAIARLCRHGECQSGLGGGVVGA